MRQGAPAHVGALLVSLLALAAGMLCTLSALDRAGLPVAAGGGLLPAGGFGASMSRAAALEAIARSDGAGAVAAARRVVSRAPIALMSTSLLGAAEALAGNSGAADAAFRAAGALGWRDEIAQAYWLDQALAVKDYGVAAERLDALLRQDVTDDRLAATVAVESTAEGRAAMAQRLAANPLWAPPYLIQAVSIDEQALANRLAVLTLAAARGFAPDRIDAARASVQLFRKGDPDASLRLWTTLQGAGDLATRGIWDSRFAHLQEFNSGAPFDWLLPYEATTIASRERGPAAFRGSALHVVSHSSLTEQVALTSVLLPSGRYRLVWEATDENQAPSPAFDIVVGCNDGPVLTTGRQQQGSRFYRSFAVPDGSCATQTLWLTVAPPDGTSWPAGWIGNVSVRPS